jgi:hypothetical protein
MTGGGSRDSYAAILADTGDITIDGLSANGNLLLKGGFSGLQNSYATIKTLRNGNINIGTNQPFQDVSLLGGNLGSASFAAIETGSKGNINLAAARDLTILGGLQGQQTYAGIEALGTGSVNTAVGRDFIGTTGDNAAANVFVKALNGPVNMAVGRDTILTGSCSIPNVASIETYGSNADLDMTTGRNLTLVGNAKLIAPNLDSVNVLGSFTPGGCGDSPVPPPTPSDSTFTVPFNMYELFWRVNTFVYYDWYGLSTDDFWLRANYTDGPIVQ